MYINISDFSNKELARDYFRAINEYNAWIIKQQNDLIHNCIIEVRDKTPDDDILWNKKEG